MVLDRNDLAQMFVIGFDGTVIDGDHPVVRSIETGNQGGVILFDRDMTGSRQNIVSPDQLRRLTSTLQEYAKTPLLIATDQEGGRVCRLKEGDGFPASVSAGHIGTANNETDTGATVETMAVTLADHGINFNLAPVVDLDINQANPIISRYERSFGSETALVVRHARQFIEAHHRHGVACCLKHFPGHGSSAADSHLGFVDITDCWQEQEIEPYRELFQTGFGDAVMTAHVVHKKLDAGGLPATLSRVILTEMLRGKLGFTGVTVSDDLQMKAISNRWNFAEAVQMAVLAGVDLLVVGNNLVRQQDALVAGVSAIEKLIKEGRIDQSRILASLERIRHLKEKIAGERPWKNRPTAL
jgi:beta-N-acetylhexosaminidase